MIFLSLLFIFIYLSLLIKGQNSLLNKLIFQLDEFSLKKETNANSISEDESIKMGTKIIFTLILGITLFICFIVFFIKALKIDIYLYPTLIMIALFFINLLSAKSSKKYDLTTEDGRYEKKKDMEKLKHRSLKGVIIQLFYLGYFSYIFYILVFLNK